MAKGQKQQGTPIPLFQGLRDRPKPRVTRPGSGPDLPNRRTDNRLLGTGAEDGDDGASHDGERTHMPSDALADPEVFFERISEKLALRVDKAASKAGLKASQELSLKLREELDDAIREAMSTADKVGTLVRQAVQAAVDDALRTAVLEATRVREQQLSQLALIDRTAAAAQDLAAVRLRIDAELKRSGLERVLTLDNLAPFDVVNPGEHSDSSAFELLVPAYVETSSGRVVQRGEVRQLPMDRSDEVKDNA
ncbi:hypothetical protein OG607_32860 [Streptomyces sp. NBC_01537]|uniref:hypothetical protein n=1 Tax=Streptomyces sp. NBC_01537 TaxID=2903896 RepID=UPI00386B50CD